MTDRAVSVATPDRIEEMTRSWLTYLEHAGCGDRRLLSRRGQNLLVG